MIDTQELSRLTRWAIDASREELREVGRGESQAENGKAEELKARRITDQIPVLVWIAARVGEKCAIVMTLSEGTDFLRPGGSNPLSPELKGAARLVWDACLQAGLTPVLQHWLEHNGDQGLHMVIRW